MDPAWFDTIEDISPDMWVRRPGGDGFGGDGADGAGGRGLGAFATNFKTAGTTGPTGPKTLSPVHWCAERRLRYNMHLVAYWLWRWVPLGAPCASVTCPRCFEMLRGVDCLAAARP